MKTKHALLGLMTQTSLHAGTGQNTGVIDLPIQREAHTHWPCVYGSAVKGALRAHLEQRAESETNLDKKKECKDAIFQAFGPDTGNAGDHASALAIMDARLLLLPVRSLTSQFKWVTCPAILQRYQQDAKRLGLSTSLRSQYPKLDMFNNPDNKPSSIKVNKAREIKVSTKKKNHHESYAIIPKNSIHEDLFLEEYRFKVISDDLSETIKALALLMQNEYAEVALDKQLVIVDNDSFSHLSEHATPVNAHIAIDSETKIVRDGALWYEETLPPDTLLYTSITAWNSRKPKPKGQKDNVNSYKHLLAHEILDTVLNLFKEKPWLQLGGNETVGMGWCTVNIIEDQTEKAKG